MHLFKMMQSSFFTSAIPWGHSILMTSLVAWPCPKHNLCMDWTYRWLEFWGHWQWILWWLPMGFLTQCVDDWNFAWVGPLQKLPYHQWKLIESWLQLPNHCESWFGDPILYRHLEYWWRCCWIHCLRSCFPAKGCTWGKKDSHLPKDKTSQATEYGPVCLCWHDIPLLVVYHILSFLLCTTIFLHDEPSVSMHLWYTYSVPYLTPSPTEVFTVSTAIPNLTFSVPHKLYCSLAHSKTPSTAKVSTHTVF